MDSTNCLVDIAGHTSCRNALFAFMSMICEFNINIEIKIRINQISHTDKLQNSIEIISYYNNSKANKTLNPIVRSLKATFIQVTLIQMIFIFS